MWSFIFLCTCSGGVPTELPLKQIHHTFLQFLSPTSSENHVFHFEDIFVVIAFIFDMNTIQWTHSAVQIH